MIERIVSGGQTGADRGGLDAAMALDISHGGWCPKGRRAEDGIVPARYQLTETKSASYQARTKRNVVDADGTVIFTRGVLEGGSRLIARFAQEAGTRPATFLPSREELIDRSEEDYFPFCVASTAPLPNPRYSHWLRAVRDPNRWRNVEQEFEGEAEFELLPVTRIVDKLEDSPRPWRSALH